MATSSGLTACWEVVAGAAPAEENAAASTAAAVARLESASSGTGDRETLENARAAEQQAAWHSTGVSNVSITRGETGAEKGGKQSQVCNLHDSECGHPTVVGGMPGAVADIETEGERGMGGAAAAAIVCWRGQLCDTPEAATGISGGGSAIHTAPKTTAAAVPVGSSAAAETADTAGCSKCCGQRRPQNETEGARDIAADAAARATARRESMTAGTGKRKTKRIFRSGGALDGAGAAAARDIHCGRKGIHVPVTPAAAAEGEELQKHRACMMAPRLKKMWLEDAAGAGETIRGTGSSSCKRSRSCVLVADRALKAGEISKSSVRSCMRCCCGCGGQKRSWEKPTPTLDGWRRLQMRRHRRQQQQQKRDRQHQQTKDTKQGCPSQSAGVDCLWHPLVSYQSTGCQLGSAGQFQLWRVAVCAAALLLAFTCGEMYGKYTCTSEYRSGCPCVSSPPLTSLPLVYTEEKAAQHDAATAAAALPAEAWGAAGAAEYTRLAHAGAAAPGGTVAETTSGEHSATATNRRQVAAASTGREEEAEAALLRTDENAFLRGVVEEPRAEKGRGREAATARAVRPFLRTGNSNALSEATASIAAVATGHSGSDEAGGRSNRVGSCSHSIPVERRSSSEDGSNSSERSSIDLSTGSRNTHSNSSRTDASYSSGGSSSSSQASVSSASSSTSSCDGSAHSSSCPRSPARSSESSSDNAGLRDDGQWSTSSNNQSRKKDSGSGGVGSGIWEAAVRQAIDSGRISFAHISARLNSDPYWSTPLRRRAAAGPANEEEDEEDDDDEEDDLEDQGAAAGDESFVGGWPAAEVEFFNDRQQEESEANYMWPLYRRQALLPSAQDRQSFHTELQQLQRQPQQQQHRPQLQPPQQAPVHLHQDVGKRLRQHLRQRQKSFAQRQQHQVEQQEERVEQWEQQRHQHVPAAWHWTTERSAGADYVTQEELVERLPFDGAASSTPTVAGAAGPGAAASWTAQRPRFLPPVSLPTAAAVRSFGVPTSAVFPLSSSRVPVPDAAGTAPDFSFSPGLHSAATPASLLRVYATPAGAGAGGGAGAAGSVAQARRLLDTTQSHASQKTGKFNVEFPRIRGEYPHVWAAPRDDWARKRLEAKLRKRLAAAALGGGGAVFASPDRRREGSSKRHGKPRGGTSRQAAASSTTHAPRLLDPHIFRRELCPFLRTGDAQLKSWFALLVLYIAEWPAYAYTGNGGKRFIDQLRYYAENFHPPHRAIAHGKKLFEDELLCGTTEVFKEGIAALKGRILNFGDMTRVLKHLAKTERDFADLLDYTQYSKLPARAAVTGFALLLRTAFEGMVFSFCKSVFLRKGLKGNFNRKELYSNVVWLYHRTQTQYWMLLLAEKIVRQIASGRPQTGIVILRSEESPRFKAIDDFSSYSSSSSSTSYDADSKGQMLEVLYGVGAFSALQRIVSGSIRKKFGWALSRFEEPYSEKGVRSSAKAVLQPHVFVTGYYGKTSQGTEVREGVFGSDVEAEALDEMIEELPAGHVLLQISLVDEWIFRDPEEWLRLHKSEADVLTAYTAVQMLRAELSWDPSLGSLGAFSVAYTGVTDLYSRQQTTAEERRYDPDVHVLLVDDAFRFVQTASEEGCRSRILTIVSEDPLQIRRTVPASRITIRGTARLLPSGELVRKGSFGMGLSLELQRSAERRLRIGNIMIHVYIRGLHRRTPETDDLDFTASELVSRLLQRSDGYYDIPIVKTVGPIHSQNLMRRGILGACGHTVPDWVVVVSSCSIAVFFLAMIVLLMYHERLKLPWWLHCFCSSASPWSVDSEAPSRDSAVEMPGLYGKKSRRKASSKSSKQTQAHTPVSSDDEGAIAAEAAAGLPLAAEGGGVTRTGTPRSDEAEDLEDEGAVFEPSSLLSGAGDGEAEEARGWLPVGAKWVGDRSLSTSSQRLKSHMFVGSMGGKKQMQQQKDVVDSDAEEEDDPESGVLHANRRMPSRQLAALGSASTSASTCAHVGPHHDSSMESSEWKVPFASPSPAVLLLQHQQPKCSFSRNGSEWDRDSRQASFDDAENGLSSSVVHSLSVRAVHSPLHYVTTSSHSCSELLVRTGSSQHHVASSHTPVHLSQQNESYVAVAATPPKDFFKHHSACNGDARRVKTALTGKQHAEVPDIETFSPPRSHEAKHASVDACAAEHLARRTLLDSCPLPAPQQLVQAELTYVPSTERNATASNAFLQRGRSASQAVDYNRGPATGSPQFVLPEEISHSSLSDATLHELEEFD